MKYVNFTEAQARLNEILDEAQRQPIAIMRQGQETAVFVSIADYERLRSGAVQAFVDLRNEVARQAAASGLTENGLTELLKDD